MQRVSRPTPQHGCPSITRIKTAAVLVQTARMVTIYTFEIEPSGDGKPCMSRERERECVRVPYRTMHFFFFLLPPRFRVSAALVACSNTSRTPSLVLAEHSRYL